MAGFFEALWKLFRPTMATLHAPGGEARLPRAAFERLKAPQAFAVELGEMHAAMAALFGLPTGNRDRLILAYQPGDFGALWAYADGSVGHHVGVPPRTWGNLVAALNRRPAVSALVHELGHVAYWWDFDPAEQAHYLLWGGAVEGSATPTGAYACVSDHKVPAWIDFPAGDRDWASLEDFKNECLQGGLAARRAGVLGQDSAGHQGHGEPAGVVEGTLWDLFFRVLGSYEAYGVVVRHYVAALRTREQAARSDEQKITDFFSLLSRAAGTDLSDYLAAWGYDVADIRKACFDLPACAARLPEVPAPRYGPVETPGWR